MLQQMMLQMFNSNPLFQRARQMAEGKTDQEIEQIAKNLCKQKGINYEEACRGFQTQVNRMFGR